MNKADKNHSDNGGLSMNVDTGDNFFFVCMVLKDGFATADSLT